MKIGLFMAPQWAPDASIDSGLAEVAAIVRSARDNGFTSLLVGQHMVLAPIRMYQPRNARSRRRSALTWKTRAVAGTPWASSCAMRSRW